MTRSQATPTRMLAMVLTLLLLAVPGARAACPEGLVIGTVVRTAPNRQSVQEIELTVARTFVPPSPGRNIGLPSSTITLTRLPSGASATGTSAVAGGTVLAEDGYERVVIAVDDSFTIDPAKDKQLRVTITGVQLECGIATLVGTDQILASESTRKDRFALTKKELEDATAYATPIDQKNFYAAVAAVKGANSDGAGAADILIDNTVYSPSRQVGALFDTAAVKFMLKKSSGANADPRSQVTGVEFTKALLWGAANRARTTGMLTSDEKTKASSGYGWTRGAVIYEFVKAEGDAYDFNALNFVSDTQLTIPSIAKALPNGFWSFRVLGGTELGRSQRKPDAGISETVTSKATTDRIARTKIGGDLTLRWGQAADNASHFAVELDFGHVTRYLYSAESTLTDVVKDGKTVQERVTIDKGARHWSQANLKVFLFASEATRYGVQVTYYDGKLPPLFAESRALQFGMVIENSPKTKSPLQ